MNPSPQLTGTNLPAASIRPAGRSGFTLVELMVSITILALILSIVGVMIGTMSQAIGNTRKLLNADDQARVIFTRMASDFSRMVTRKDVDIIFAKASGTTTASGKNDAIYFVTEASGSNVAGTASGYYTSTNANLLALAGYCIADDAQSAQVNSTVTSPLQDLNRLGHALTWDPVSASNTSPDNLVFVSFAAPTSGSSTSALIANTTLDGHWGSSTIGSTPTYTPPKLGANYPDYHAIGDQVFRFEYCFLLKDGTYSNFPVITPTGIKTQLAGSGPPAPTNDSTQGYSAGSRWFDATNGRAFLCSSADTNNAVWGPLGISDVSAIVVAIALLDRDSRLKITDPTVYANLPNVFADSLQNTTTTATTLSTRPVSTATSTFSAGNTTEPLVLMQQNWQTTMNASGFAGSVNLPVTTAGHIRIYQRYFYLNANNL